MNIKTLSNINIIDKRSPPKLTQLWKQKSGSPKSPSNLDIFSQKQQREKKKDNKA